MMIEDFTKLPPGSIVSNARTIISCPLCRRRGALELRRDGSQLCVHLETSVIHTDGMLVEPRDSCPLTARFEAGA